MADIVVKIKTNDGYDKIETFSADKPVNNVSTPTNEETTPNDGVNGKSMALGYVTLLDGYIGGQDTFLISEMNKYNGYMFGATDAEGNYDVGIEIFGVTFDKINIVGDKNANQFPTMAILDEGTEDEKTVYNDDLEFGIAFAKESDSHTIRFLKWNRANYNACFTTMTVFVESLEYNRAYIDELLSSSESSFDAETINYGVVSNSGDLKLLDIDGEIADYIKDGIIDNSNLQIEIVLNGKTIQHHITGDSSYNDRDRMLSLGLTNKMSLWDKIDYNGFNLIKGSLTAYDMLKIVMAFVGYEDIYDLTSSPAVYGKDNIVGTVKTYLESTIIEYPYLEKSTFREAVEKFCYALGLNVYEDENGKPKFVSARPVATQKEIDNAIEINSYMQISELEKDIITKNKIRSAGVVENNYFLEQKKIFTFNTSFYDQTVDALMSNIKQTSNDQNYYNMMLYSGRIAAYTQNLSSNEGVEFLTSSPVPLATKNSDGNIMSTGNFYYPVKITFSTNEKSYFENWFVNNPTIFGKGGTALFPSDCSINATADNVLTFPKPETSTPNFLVNQNLLANDILSKDGNAPYQYVNNEKTALNNLCYYAGGSISAIKDNITMQIIRDGDRFTIYYVIRVYSNIGYTIDNYTGNLTAICLNGTNYVYQTCLSNKKTDTTENKDYVLTTNELVASNNKINGETVSSCLISNILEDYKTGVMVANIDTFCGDYYNKDGSKLVDFGLGELLKPNTVVFFKGDNTFSGEQRYWRVTGSSFNSLDISNKLSLIEIKKAYSIPIRKITFPTNVEVYNGDVKLNSGDGVEEGTKLRIYFTGSDLRSISVGGVTVTQNNYMYEIHSDSNVVVEYYEHRSSEKSFVFPSTESQATTFVFDANYEELAYDLEIYCDDRNYFTTISKDEINSKQTYTTNALYAGSPAFAVQITSNAGVNRTIKISNVISYFWGQRGLVHCDTRYIKTSSGI